MHDAGQQRGRARAGFAAFEVQKFAFAFGDAAERVERDAAYRAIEKIVFFDTSLAIVAALIDETPTRDAASAASMRVADKELA